MKKSFFAFAIVASILNFQTKEVICQIQSDPSLGGGFGGPTLQVLTNPESLLAESRLGMWLVKAKCVSVTQDGQKLAVWRIEYAFNAPKELIGREFSRNHQQSYGDFNSPTLIFVPKEKEEAIWSVRVVQGVTRGSVNSLVWANDSTRLAYAFNLPIHQSDPLFPEALLYAQSIERVARAPRNEQIRLLGVYAKSAMPQRSAWAIATLAESGLESAPPFLLGLASDPKIPVAGQLALDRGLASLHETRKVTWNRSNARWALWRRIVTSKSGEDQAIAVVSEIVDRGQREAQLKRVAVAKKTAYVPTIEGGRLFEWLRLGAANRNWTPSSRAFALGSVGNLSRQNVIGRGAAWNFLLPILKTHPELQAGARAADFPDAKPFSSEAIIANGALSGLAWLRPFSSQELQTLRALQTRAKTRFLRSGLDGLLAKKR